MAMILKYGNYSFDAGAVLVRSSMEKRINKGGQPVSEIRRLECEGYLSADGQAALTAAQNSLEAALAVNDQDLTLYLDDAATPSATYLDSSESISGVKIVKGPDFRNDAGAEYATFRKFSFTAEGEFPFDGTQNYLLEFEETLHFEGGGPIFRHRLALNGLPQKQLVYPASIYKATQSGRAVGYLKRPGVPPPIWPKDWINAPGTFDERSPERRGTGGYEHFAVTWRYEFESAKKLVGIPNRWL